MGKKTILIIDDEENIQSVLARALALAGYATIQAMTGREGLRIVKAKKPDLIILDVAMPDIDGGKVGSILKEDPETKHIPVIYLTGMIAENQEIAGKTFMAKPCSWLKLLAEIRKRLPPAAGAANPAGDDDLPAA